MKKLGIGVQTSKTWFNEANPAESIRFIKNCGFEVIDYNIGGLFLETFDAENLTSFFDKSIEELYEYYKPFKAALAETGIEISQFHGLFSIYKVGETEKNKYFVAVTEKMLAVCAYLGCKAMVIHPWTGLDVHKEEEIRVNMNFYRQIIPMAKRYGVVICLENLFKPIHGKSFEGTCSSASEACRYIDTLNEEAGQKCFGFCLDVGHANMVGKNLYQYIVGLGDRLTIMHIHENDGVNDSHMIPFTQRDRTGFKSPIHWDTFVRGLREIGYEGPLSFETVLAEEALPEEVREEGLRLISAIGKYFRKTMEEGSFDRR